MLRATHISQTDSHRLLVSDAIELLGLEPPGPDFHVHSITFEFYGAGLERETIMKVTWQRLTLQSDDVSLRLDRGE